MYIKLHAGHNALLTIDEDILKLMAEWTGQILVVIVFLMTVSAVHGAAGPSRVVPASDVLAKLEEGGQTAEFDNCTITGDLDLHSRVIYAQVHFNDSSFLDPVHFNSTNFKGPAYFRRSNFNDDADFSGADFTSSAYFNSSRFNGSADFSRAKFSYADFMFSSFNSSVDFSEASFNGSADFRWSTLKKDAYFMWSKFNSSALFIGANFNSAYFKKTNFERTADFSLSNFYNSAYFRETNFNRSVDFRKSTFNSSADFNGSEFNSSADFSKSVFNDSAHFSETNFTDSADFSNSRFKGHVEFYDSKFNRKAFFYDVGFAGFTSFRRGVFADDAFFDGAVFRGELSLTRTKYDKLYIKWDNISRLEYDESAYQLLIENFKKFGYYDDADNGYYQFRTDRFLHRKLGKDPLMYVLDLGAWIFYGFGKRPILPLVWSIGTMLLFGVFWSAILIRGHENYSANRYGLALGNSTDGYSLVLEQGGNKHPERSDVWDNIHLILEPFLLSATIFLSSTRLFIDPPETPKSLSWPISFVKGMFTLERVLGAFFSILLFLAISETVVR